MNPTIFVARMPCPQCRIHRTPAFSTSGSRDWTHCSVMRSTTFCMRLTEPLSSSLIRRCTVPSQASWFSSQRLILVDWDLRLACGQPEAVVNETCRWPKFDAQGTIDPHASRADRCGGSADRSTGGKLGALVSDNVDATVDTEITP